MEATKPEDRPRNRDDMEYEIRYSIRLLTLHANLARNADVLLTGATLLGLAGGVGSMVNQSGILASVAGGALTVVAVAQVLFKPAEKKLQANFRKQSYADLWSRFRRLSDDEIDSELAKLHGSDLNEIEGLRLIAEFDVCKELGLDETELTPMTTWNRLLKAVS
ncbi:hypothetical protein FIU83_06345 [Halomonas sp. THAF5a]|uniref:hypothetical protein n=1 Tax=Halomonas sp. THAF5a TaxID=2587844 RepID=UPI001267F652|nr:hypothetical protein [Halomonas sp. THAF5a]QFU01255.1 hypothetical protein FIU83_06345 [Halomonas sp. THAF5a]